MSKMVECSVHRCKYALPTTKREKEQLIGECPRCLLEERDRLKEAAEGVLTKGDLMEELTEEFTHKAVDSLHRLMVWEACGMEPGGKIDRSLSLGMLSYCEQTVKRHIEDAKSGCLYCRSSGSPREADAREMATLRAGVERLHGALGIDGKESLERGIEAAEKLCSEVERLAARLEIAWRAGYGEAIRRIATRESTDEALAWSSVNVAALRGEGDK